jgi:hypothetical protein
MQVAEAFGSNCSHVGNFPALEIPMLALVALSKPGVPASLIYTSRLLVSLWRNSHTRLIPAVLAHKARQASVFNRSRVPVNAARGGSTACLHQQSYYSWSENLWRGAGESGGNLVLASVVAESALAALQEWHANCRGSVIYSLPLNIHLCGLLIARRRERWRWAFDDLAVLIVDSDYLFVMAVFVAERC